MASLLNMSGGRLVGLPYDAEVEYLEGDGASYIDTGIIVSTPYSINGKFLVAGKQLSSNAYFFFGAGISYENRNIECYSGVSASKLSVLHQGVMEFDYPYNTKPFTVNYKNKKFIVTNGENTYQYTSDRRQLTTPYTMGVFSTHRSRWVVSQKSVRCYWFTIEDENSVSLIDFIPVRVGTTGYMYDKVSGTLFGNSGTGSFILGADKTN